MTTPLRVVLDTNALISALVFRRENWTWLREHWKTKRCVPLLCSATTLELITVLNYPKFRLTKDDQAGLLAELLPFAQTCPDPTLTPPLPVCRDPKDQVFLALAVQSQATYLITGDKHLLEYPTPEGLSIHSPSEFRALLETAKRSDEL